MHFARNNVMSPEELAREYEMSESRLADLRSQRKGPPYFKFGGIWYPRDGFDEWVQKQMIKGDDDVAKKEERQMALPVQAQRPRAHGEHRFGRHSTKQGGGRRDRNGSAETPQDREAAGE
jgi:hypothetical protein